MVSGNVHTMHGRCEARKSIMRRLSNMKKIIWLHSQNFTKFWLMATDRLVTYGQRQIWGNTMPPPHKAKIWPTWYADVINSASVSEIPKFQTCKSKWWSINQISYYFQSCTHAVLARPNLQVKKSLITIYRLRALQNIQWAKILRKICMGYVIKDSN